MNLLYRTVIDKIRDTLYAGHLCLPKVPLPGLAAYGTLAEGDADLREQINRVFVRMVEQLRVDTPPEYQAAHEHRIIPVVDSPERATEAYETLRLIVESLSRAGAKFESVLWQDTVILAAFLVEEHNGWPHSLTYDAVADMVDCLLAGIEPAFDQRVVDDLLNDLKETNHARP